MKSILLIAAIVAIICWRKIARRARVARLTCRPSVERLQMDRWKRLESKAEWN